MDARELIYQSAKTKIIIMTRVLFIVCTLGERSVFQTIDSLLSITDPKILLHCGDEAFFCISRNILVLISYIVMRKKKSGIYAAMNDALDFAICSDKVPTNCFVNL